MTMPAIETRALHKRYGSTVALEALDIRVEPGEVFGFLGPNGAGKTTAVKLLLGLTRPTGGEGKASRVKFDVSLREQIRKELEAGLKSVAELSREYGPSHPTIMGWKRQWGLTRPRQRRKSAAQ